jgi:hypothetical protein
MRYQKRGITDRLPVFNDSVLDRTTFPFSWTSGHFDDFTEWRTTAREKFTECLMAPSPIAPFEPEITGEEDRGTHTAKRAVFNISADSRVLGYICLPKGDGPFPAVLMLHDHGARFDIGKEKVIRPFNEPSPRHDSADEWSHELYGGRFIGDELAARGYITFATDALFWSDRGGVPYTDMPALSCNLQFLGMSLAGIIAHEDVRAAEFVAGLPDVDSARVSAMGLSMGSVRTWQVCALTDVISASVSICWMTTLHGQLQPGINMTTGGYPFCHPGLHNLLDFPDLASIACPKPMLFYNGRRDGLFTVESTEEAYAKLHAVWDSQGVGDRLETRLWDVPHEFTVEMQETAFDWLDGWMKG